MGDQRGVARDGKTVAGGLLAGYCEEQKRRAAVVLYSCIVETPE
jgi:hypothetical protein